MAKKKTKRGNTKKFVSKASDELTANDQECVKLVEKLIKEGDRKALVGLASCASAYMISFFISDGDTLERAKQKQEINSLCSLHDMAEYLHKRCLELGCGNCESCQQRIKLIAEVLPLIEEARKTQREAMN